ncbi:hypothetical protein EDD15DRAFT_2374725 [Pisolithus albus]|nr:hypothetical protein EDD15DRAFT_2374725 [Pisolithus albus]
MDNAFKMCIHNTTGVQEIGNPLSSDWLMVFAQYGSEVPKKMQEQVDVMTERGNLSQLQEHIVMILKISPLKAWMLFTCETRQEDFCSFPFMSQSLFKVLKEHLSHIQMAILELLSWWLPYIYVMKVHQKEWKLGSATREELSGCTQIFMQTHIDIILIIFKSYLAFLNMEGQLSMLNVPDHSLSQSVLLGIFRMPGSKPAKLIMSKKGKVKKMDEEEYGDQDYMDEQDKDKKHSDEEDEDMSADDNEDQDVQKGELRQEHLDRCEKEKVQAEFG